MFWFIVILAFITALGLVLIRNAIELHMYSRKKEIEAQAYAEAEKEILQKKSDLEELRHYDFDINKKNNQ